MEEMILETVAQMELKNVLNQYVKADTTPSVEKINGQIIESRIVNVTPQLATQLISRNVLNRSINSMSVLKYATAMANDEWNYDGQPLSFDNLGRLLNGQHRLQAVIKSGKTITFKIECGFKTEIFSTFDIGKNRTGGDVLEIAGYKNPKVLANTGNFVAQYIRGSIGKNVIVTNNPARSNGNGTLTHEQLLRFVNDNKGLEDSIKFVLSEKKGKRACLLSPYILAGFHFLFTNKDVTIANEFISKLIKGTNIDDNSPIYVLREKLNNSNRATEIGGNKADKLVHNEIIKLIVQAWGMYRRNEKTSMRKFTIPAVLPLIQ